MVRVGIEVQIGNVHNGRPAGPLALGIHGFGKFTATPAALAALAQSVDASNELRALLFCFDDQKGQLVLAATSDPALFDESALDYAVPSGRTIVSQAYRRRKPVIVVDAKGLTSEDIVYDEPMPFEKRPHVAPASTRVTSVARRRRRSGRS